MMHKCLKVFHLATCQINFQLELLSMIDIQDIERRINAGQRAFYYRGVKIWNNLSKDLRDIIDTNAFKRRLINELICNMN